MLRFLYVSAQIALRALNRNRLRTVLTMLGVIIGVAAVIAMVAVGGGAREQVVAQIRSLGSNLLIVTPGNVTSGGVRMGSGAASTLTDDDAAAIATEIPGVQTTAPNMRGTAQLIAGGMNWATAVFGIDSGWFEARDWEVDYGRMFEPEEVARGAQVAIIGQTVARNLYGGRISLAVGVTAMLLAMTVGTFIGLFSGFIPSLDGPLMRFTDMMFALPQLPLLLVIIMLFRDTLRGLFGPEVGIFLLVVFVIGILGWMPTARIVRGSVLSIKRKEFVEAAEHRPLAELVEAQFVEFAVHVGFLSSSLSEGSGGSSGGAGNEGGFEEFAAFHRLVWTLQLVWASRQ